MRIIFYILTTNSQILVYLSDIWHSSIIWNTSAVFMLMLNKYLKKKIGVSQHVSSMGAKQEGMHVELEDGRGAQQGYKVLFSFWFVQNTSLVVGL